MDKFSFIKLSQIVLAGLLVNLCVFLSNGFPISGYAASTFKKTSPSLLPYQYIGLADAIKTFNNPNSAIVDARSAIFYDAGHIMRAINLPPSEYTNTSVFKSNISELKHASSVMVYCSSSCGAAAEVSTALINAGVENVVIYGEGWIEWSACHLPSAGDKPEVGK
jgi:3-mercaptopyruvate sulfurtransferase SseA